MTIKKSILTIVLLFLTSNILTTIWYMVNDNANFVTFRREEMNYLGLMINHLIYASLFVVLFPPYYEKAPALSRGFIYGMLMSAVMFLPSGIVVRSIWAVDFNGIFLLNSLAHIIIGGLMGIIAALIYNYKK